MNPDEDWATWSLADLRDRVAVVQAFDALADTLREAFLCFLRTYDIVEETDYVPRQRFVLVPA